MKGNSNFNRFFLDFRPFDFVRTSFYAYNYKFISETFPQTAASKNIFGYKACA